MNDFAAEARQRAVAPAPTHSLWLVACALALLLGLQPIVTDLYLPALPRLAVELAATPAATQLTMSALILAFGLMQLVWGPVADRFGRRPVLLTSLALLSAAGIGAALAPHIGALVAWRTAQGAMLAAAVVCARAMVRDLYEPHQGAQVMALGLSGLGVLAIAAPVAGGALAAWAGWRTNLAVVAAMACVAWLFIWRALPETLLRPNPRALHAPTLARNALAVLAHPGFRAWALLVACTYGGLFIILSASSFAYIGVFGLSPAQYGVVLGAGSLCYLAGTLVCRRWIVRHGLAGTVARGALFSAAGAAGMLACALADRPALALLLAAHGTFTFGHGVHQPCGQTGAIGPFPQMAGLASALAGCVLALAAFAIGAWLGAAMDGSLRPMALGVAACGLATAAVALTLVQRLK